MINIIPIPQKISFSGKKCDVSSLHIKCSDENISEMFKTLHRQTGKTETSIVYDAALKGEAYKLDIEDNSITILYGEPVGAFRAFSTLKQIIAQNENGEVPQLSAEDYPSLENRGYMLDISRGKIPKAKYLKELVDILAELKYNQLQLYMESFVFEYKNFPDYWKDTQPLTKEETAELDKYCKERFIQLVPNQNSFGHMSSWLEKPELSHLAITGSDGKPSSTLNPCLDGTLEFIDKIYDGYFDAFSADTVNIGMDEPIELGLNETKEICEKKGIGKVYADYLNKVCGLILEKYKKRPMFWDDIIFKHPEQLANIPKEAVLMQWGYEAEHHFERNCQMIKEKGLKFYVCPGTSMWNSITGRSNNALVNITSAAECGAYYGAEGFLLTEWGDDGHPQCPFVSYLPLVLGAACSWNSGSHNTEIAYGERRNLISGCKKYLDKFIYKIRNNVSLADIVYRMGNYYLLENSLLFNGTELFKFLGTHGGLNPEETAGIGRVFRYMNDLKDELEKADANENALSEITLGCDLVILAASIILNKPFDAEEVLQRYKEIWEKRNHSAGENIFPDIIRRCISAL